MMNFAASGKIVIIDAETKKARNGFKKPQAHTELIPAENSMKTFCRENR